MTPWLDDGDVQLMLGDCVTVMAAMPEASVDVVVTDPPYGLGFMGKDWDSPGGTGDFPMRRTTEANTVNTGVSRQGGRQRSCDRSKRVKRLACECGALRRHRRSECSRCQRARLALGIHRPTGRPRLASPTIATAVDSQ